MSSFKPEFQIRMEGHAFARYLGPRDEESIKLLYLFLKREKWRGQLRVNFTGNGGITDITFDEVRRITKEPSPVA